MIPDAARRSGHDGQATSHGLEHDQAQGFRHRCEDERIAVGVEVGQSAAPVEKAEKCDARRGRSPKLRLAGTGSRHDEVNHSSGQAFAGEPKGVDDLICPLLWSQTADMDEGKPAAHAERRTHGLAPATRVKQFGIDPSAPDLDVVHLEPDEIPARDGRRSKDSPASTMKSAQV
jgi:hypothetical protein